MRGRSSQSEGFESRFESAFARLQVAVLDACSRERHWPAQVGAGVHAALGFAAAEPAAARTLTIEAKLHRDTRGRRYLRLLDYFAELLRADAPGDSRRPPLTELALVGSLATMVAERFLCKRPRGMVAMAPDLVEFILLPYLGAEEAKAQAVRYRR